MSIVFRWDTAKAAANTRKHGVTFEQAITVFADPLARIFDDEAHSRAESRELIVGHSARGQLLVVSFTEHGSVIRLISARTATKRERQDYEDGTKST